MTVPDATALALTDEALTAQAMSVVAAQKSTLTGLSWIGSLAFGWFLKVVQGYLVTWIIEIVVAAAVGVTLVVAAEWLASRFKTVSPAVLNMLGFKSAARFGSTPQYIATVDPDFPGDWHVRVVGQEMVEASFPDGEDRAKAYARLLNTGIPLF
jgi:hypothetical protein